MATTANFKKGMTISLNNEIMTLIDFQHVKPGKGGAFVRTKLKRLKDGAVIDKTFRAGEKVDVIRMEEKKMQYLYRDSDIFFFMDTETYEQMPLSSSLLSDIIPYLKEDEEVSVLFAEGEPVGVHVPIFSILKVVETTPGVKGNTAQSGSKPAVLETGFTVRVPLFINVGDRIKVDTRTGEYVERE